MNPLCAGSLLKTPDNQSGEGGSHPTPALHSLKDLRVDLVPRAEIKNFVETHHYSHNLRGVKTSFCFRVTLGQKLVGAVVFGGLSTTAWKRFSATESEVIELRRLVLLDEIEKYSESRVIGIVLRWLKKNATKISVVVSYADPAHGHDGKIYRATNFVYQGTTATDVSFRDPETGKTYHSRCLRKKKDDGSDFMPFAKNLREKLAAGKLEKILLPGKHRYVFKLK